MEIALTKMSSKGQIVIPKEMRSNLKEGDTFVIIKSNKQIILKKAKDFDKNVKEDLEFAKRTEESWKEYERGEFTSQSTNEFLEDLKKWAKGK